MLLPATISTNVSLSLTMRTEAAVQNMGDGKWQMLLSSCSLTEKPWLKDLITQEVDLGKSSWESGLHAAIWHNWHFQKTAHLQYPHDDACYHCHCISVSSIKNLCDYMSQEGRQLKIKRNKVVSIEIPDSKRKKPFLFIWNKKKKSLKNILTQGKWHAVLEVGCGLILHQWTVFGHGQNHCNTILLLTFLHSSLNFTHTVYSLPVTSMLCPMWRNMWEDYEFRLYESSWTDNLFSDLNFY